MGFGTDLLSSRSTLQDRLYFEQHRALLRGRDLRPRGVLANDRGQIHRKLALASGRLVVLSLARTADGLLTLPTSGHSILPGW